MNATIDSVDMMQRMSTYSTIQGAVTLDVAAAAAFVTTPSWKWCEQEETITTQRTDEGLRIEFEGGPYRNLCRHLLVDLVDVQRFGSVYGTITDDCVDGGNDRTVVRYHKRTVLVGSGSCLREPVTALPGRIVSFPDVDIRALLPHSPLTTGIAVTLEGAPALDECACGGWDEEGDTAVCCSEDRV